MQPLSSSDDDGGDLFSTREKKIGTRRSMRSLFASDDMQARHGVTSLRYEDQTRLDKSVSLSIATPVPGAPPNAPSPLQTAAQGVAMAYKGDTCVGPCVVALCVPHANAPPAAVALIAIVDREKRAQCRVRLDAHLQLLQNPTEPQYASLYDPALGAHWSLMFKDRRACTEFVAAVFTAQHCADAESAAAPLFADWGHSAEPVAPAVRKGSSVTISFMSWLLRRVPNTRFFALGKLIDEVPPEAPRDASVGVGEMMAGVEEALLGMTRETARIVFVPPRKTHVRRGMGNPEIGPSDTVVVHIMCHEVRPGGEIISTPISATPAMRSVAVDKAEATPRREDTHRTPQPQQTQNALSADPNSLLQAILLQTLQQQQQQQQQNGGSGNGSSGGSSIETVERSLDRVQMQLSSLYEKIDRLSIDEKLEKNNAAIERIVKRAVGKAPVSDIDVEDAAKDRDALLASIERLKSRLDEANDNYHRALEAMGRHKDETQHLQNDLRIQRDAHDARVRQLEETARLREVEAEVRHRQALDHSAAEQFRLGREEGLREGALQGQRDALEAAGAHTSDEWRERLFAAEQRALRVESEMHEREARHHAERRRLQEEADALRETVARLERIAAEKGAGDYDAPDRVAQRRKQLRRALNAVYTNAEAQMSAASTENPLIHMEDALRMVFVAVKAESKVFLDEIAKEAALRAAPEAVSLPEYRETAEEEAMETVKTVENHVEDGNADYADGMAKKDEEESNIKVDELPPAPPRETPAVFFGSGDAAEFPDPPILTLHGNGEEEEEEETERNNN